jgi:hypothetical protein
MARETNFSVDLAAKEILHETFLGAWFPVMGPLPNQRVHNIYAE